MFDDDLPKKTASEFPRSLENMSVDELQEYIVELNTEISRVQIDAEKKLVSKASADSVFKS